MDQYLLSSPTGEYDQRNNDFFEPIAFDDKRSKKSSLNKSLSSGQLYPNGLISGPQLPVNPLYLGANNIGSGGFQQQLQVQQQFHQIQLQKQFQQQQQQQLQQQNQQHSYPIHQHQHQHAQLQSSNANSTNGNVRTSQSLLDLVPQLSLSILNQLLSDSPALLHNSVTPRRTGRKKSSSFSSAYATPSRNYLPANALSQLNLQSSNSNLHTSSQWISAANTANGAGVGAAVGAGGAGSSFTYSTFSNKIGKTPYRHSRLRSKASMDASIPYLLPTSASASFNPFCTPSSFGLPHANDELLGTDYENLENSIGTPLPTPEGSYTNLTSNQSSLSTGDTWFVPNGYVTPTALDLDGKIEEQGDDALMQLRKAKNPLRLKLNCSNEFGGVLYRPPASAPPSGPNGALHLDEIASHLESKLTQLTPGIQVSDNLPPLYLFTPGENLQQVQEMVQSQASATIAHRQSSQNSTQSLNDMNNQQTSLNFVDLIQGFGSSQQAQQELLLPSFQVHQNQQHNEGEVASQMHNSTFISGGGNISQAITQVGPDAMSQSGTAAQVPIDPKKKYLCPICNARFQRQEHVKRHLKSHLSEKPYACDEPDCGKKFNRKDNLKAHLKKIHKRI